MTRADPLILKSDDRLMIRWLPGNSARLILAFTGVQHRMGGLPMDEFIGAASADTRNHVLFISDMKRSWYSSKALVRRIVRAVKAFITTHDIRETFAIGNSMGGYGAIRFASLLPITKVVAFSPQISLHPATILEIRWAEFRASFGPDLLRSLRAPIQRSNARFFLFFGGESQPDRDQARLLPEIDRLTVRFLRGCDHDAAAHLKKALMLAPLLAEIFGHDPVRLAKVDALLEGRV